MICKTMLHKLPASERALLLDTVVHTVVCCVDLIVTTTGDDNGNIFVVLSISLGIVGIFFKYLTAFFLFDT